MTRDTQGSGIENPGPRPFTVQCVCAAWLSNTITVQASDIEDACRRAIETATRDSAWRSTGACGPTFVDAITEGEDAIHGGWPLRICRWRRGSPKTARRRLSMRRCSACSTGPPRWADGKRRHGASRSAPPGGPTRPTHRESERAAPVS
jgi:hypothetical protein